MYSYPQLNQPDTQALIQQALNLGAQRGLPVSVTFSDNSSSGPITGDTIVALVGSSGAKQIVSLTFGS